MSNNTSNEALQFCTLIRTCFLLLQRTCTTDMLVDDLNSFSTAVEPRCGEYSFKLKMNPWQHPIFDENIHHLLALLPALCSGCGGVIYLMTEDVQTVPQQIFQIYKERLCEIIGTNVETFRFLTNMVQVSLLLGTHRSWAALMLKKSHDTRNYRPIDAKGIWKPMSLELDKFGQLHTRLMSDTQSQSSIEMERIALPPDQVTERSKLRESYNTNIPHQTEPKTLFASVTAAVTVSEGQNDTSIPVVDFSSCQRLDWAENTKDWQKYVKIKKLKADDIVESCSMWKPADPMKFTPDRESLGYLFESENYMDETLSRVTTLGPGCAVVCRTWRFHISDGDISEDLPPGHICDILTVTDTGRMSFWVVVDSLDEEKNHNQMKYLMTTGRMLKYQIVQKGEGDDLSNLWIHCRLLPLHTSHPTDETVRLRLSESHEIQAHLCDMYQDGVDFTLLRRALTKLILSKESPLKRYVGEHTSITLSVQQAEVLMHKAKVNYITGPAGSGKSYTGASICKLYGMERSVYICTTKEFLEYLKFNGYTGILVLGDRDLSREIKSGIFENKLCVVIDDCHNFSCTRKSMKKLFQVLKKTKGMSLFVFADNDYQSFDRRRQQTVHDCILDLTRTVLKVDPLIFPLTAIYRNTRKVVSFAQAAIQAIDDSHQKIESANMENGEGVQCIAIPNLWENSPENGLIVYLRSLLLTGSHNQSEVAILFESENTADQIQQCKQIVAKHMPSVTVQSADVFPRTGVIIDSVDSFLGLDAGVCVFILSNTQKRSDHRPRKIFQRQKMQFECEMNMYNPRYEVFLASRAIHKAVFVVPELHEDLVHQMKFDNFQVCFY